MSYPKPANKLGLMLLAELSRRHEQEKQEALRLLAAQDEVPLDGTIYLNAGQWVLSPRDEDTTGASS